MAPRLRESVQIISPKKNEPFRQGEILTDVHKRLWKLGKCIDVGAFGEVYLASDDLGKPVGYDSPYVIKIEPFSNGPLFVEMNFYHRVAKDEIIENWQKAHKKKHLGIPTMCGFGSHTYRNEKYRFIVLPRYGENVQKLFSKHRNKFHIKTALTLACHVMDVLEYVHGQGFLHLDIKGANVVMGEGCRSFLLDWGLATRYLLPGSTRHRPPEPDLRSSNIGTLHYCSRDSHQGVLTRRSDLESLGYNLVHWLSGRLPWLEPSLLGDDIFRAKQQAFLNIKQFLLKSFMPHSPPKALIDFLQYVSLLGPTSEPDYSYCRAVFSKGIRDSGFLDDDIVTFDHHTKYKSKKRKEEAENMLLGVKIAKTFHFDNDTSSRRPCAVQNLNSIRTRNRMGNCIKLRSAQEFNWAKVLAGDPERELRKNKKEKIKPRDYVDSEEMIEQEEEEKRTLLLANPTPAMQRQIQRHNRPPTPPPFNIPQRLFGVSLTPAMIEVLAAQRTAISSPPFRTRASRRLAHKHAADAIIACYRY